MREKLTHKIMIDAGFVQTDWYYNKIVNGKEFTVGYLFVETEYNGAEFDKVDIFYGENKLYKIPLAFTDELKFFYEKLTGEKFNDEDALSEEEIQEIYMKKVGDYIKSRKKPFSLFPAENFCTCEKPWTVSGICRVCEKPFKNKK